MSLPRIAPPLTHRDRLPADSRYELLVKIASGGMASVYVGRLQGAVGFRRLVAIKRAHAHLLEDPAFREMLISEAHVASKIHHPNVVAVLDVEQLEEELLLVMDYVEGASLSDLEIIATKTKTPIPARAVLRIALDACAGLHAAHELTDEDGTPLRIIHRDISPQNVLIGLDGMTRIADFGIAKCTQEGTSLTSTGALKGKVAYMSPEYIRGGRVDVRSDIFALGAVLWEAITNQRLFRGSNELETMKRVAEAPIPRVSEAAPWVGTWLDEPIAKALERAPAQRHDNARAFAHALEAAAARGMQPASYMDVSERMKAFVGDPLAERRKRIRERVAVLEGRESISDGEAYTTPAHAHAPSSSSRKRLQPPDAAGADAPRSEKATFDADSASHAVSTGKTLASTVAPVVPADVPPPPIASAADAPPAMAPPAMAPPEMAPPAMVPPEMAPPAIVPPTAIAPDAMASTGAVPDAIAPAGPAPDEQAPVGELSTLGNSASSRQIVDFLGSEQPPRAQRRWLLWAGLAVTAAAGGIAALLVIGAGSSMPESAESADSEAALAASSDPAPEPPLPASAAAPASSASAEIEAAPAPSTEPSMTRPEPVTSAAPQASASSKPVRSSGQSAPGSHVRPGKPALGMPAPNPYATRPSKQ